MAQLQVGGIVIVSPSVAPSEEGLACILSCHETQLHIVAIRQLVAQPVAIGRTQIALTVALALVEGDARRGHQLVVPVLRDILQSQVVPRVCHLAFVYI